MVSGGEETGFVSRKAIWSREPQSFSVIDREAQESTMTKAWRRFTYIKRIGSSP